ncbi:MAG TPA: beta-propeller fold lactonase family protein [Stellaceae bacterium]|nr:beta-propeller fold lactonase family protein [Stellaceae bacterium]
MQELDLRATPPGEILRNVIAAYERLPRGERIAIALASYAARLRMGLVEAGAKHEAERTSNGDWRLVVHGASRSLSTAPGVHHVVAGPNGDVWTCERARRAARIDGAAQAVAAVRAVAQTASHMALDAARGRLFIGDAGGNALVCVRASDLEPLGRWDVPGSPQLPVVNEEGVACVTGGGAGVLGIVWPMGDGFRAKLIEVGTGPHDPLALPDGSAVLVPCAGDGVVVRVSLADGAVSGRFPVGDGPAHLALHPDGTRIYVANTFDGTLACLSPEGDVLGRTWSGNWAHVPKVTPDGRLVYVANFYDDTLTIFDARTLDRVAEVKTDPYPHGLDISPDGTKVVATGFCGDHARIFDGATGRELSHIAIGEGSAHTAIVPDSCTGFVGCSISDHIAVVDLAAGRRSGVIRLN